MVRVSSPFLALLLAAALLILTAFPLVGPVAAHEGHDHGESPSVTEGGGAPPAGSGPVDIEGFARAIDGDTIESWIAGSRAGIGFIGVEVMNANTPCGVEAAQTLQSMIYGGLHLEEDPELIFDAEQRRMYYAYTPEGQSIAAALVDAGMAYATGEGRDAAILHNLEAAARDAGRGCLWDDDHLDALTSPTASATTTHSESRAMLALPEGFRQEEIVDELNFPTDFEILPDGRILIAEKDGLVRIFENGQISTFVDLRSQVNDYWDRGLLSLVADPNFSANGYVYFLFTYEHDASDYSGTKTARLIRLTATDNTASLASKFIVLGSVNGDSCNDFPSGADCIPSDSPSHSAGGMDFAPDGTLFVTLGEGANFNVANNDALRAQNLDSLAGKVVRITTTGDGLSNNPFWTGHPDDVRSKVWAYGLRNAYRFSVRPDNGVPYVADVGWGSWEEVNVAAAGANLGWPCYEGEYQQGAYSWASACQALYATDSVTSPLVAWSHSSGGSAATGGVFYTGDKYPEAYQGAYFYGDYVRGFIRYLKTDANDQLTGAPAEFFDQAGGPVSFEMGADGYIYFLAINSGDVRRIVYDDTGLSGTHHLSDLVWTSASNGWGPVERNMSNGEDALGDGEPLSIGGVSYEKGLGVHALSEIVYHLGGHCSTFGAIIGVDDEAGDNGSVVFNVYGDGVQVASSGTMRGSGPSLAYLINIDGVDELRLSVTDAGDGITWDHADWADASVTCAAAGPTVDAVTPEDGATIVPVESNITATFSKPIDESTLPGNVTLANPRGTQIAGALSYEGSSATLTFNPDADLLTSTTYTATLRGGPAGITDADGNPLEADVVWSFTTADSTGPVPAITSPNGGDDFIIGETISYAGGAVDAEGNPLPASSLSWQVLIHHCNYIDCHTHQVIEVAGVASGDFVVPDHGDQFYFEIVLTATGSQGLTGETSVEIHPRTVDVTLNTVPSGLQVNLSGETAIAPLTRPIVVGSQITISAPTPQGLMTFDGWSDGGAASHNLTVGEQPLALTATFTESDPGEAVYLSDLQWVSAANGWGPVERDLSNGEDAIGDGGPLTIGGATYQKGLGVHAPSEIVYSLGGTCSLFSAQVGLDDEVGNQGSVTFEVWADGVQLYDSGPLTGAMDPVDVILNLSGQADLRLITTDGGDNNWWDHADWGDARITCTDPPADTTPPTVTNSLPADGSTGIAISATISATFSEAMDETTFTGTVSLLAEGGASVPIQTAYDAGTRTVTLTPDSALTAGTTYTVTVAGGVTDVTGNPLGSDHSWTFTTAAETGPAIYLSDLPWTSASNGWGPVERDTSNGEEAAGDGAPLTINGTSYMKGLGVHANSEIIYALDGTCTLFSAQVGVDDEAGSNGSVEFRVLSGTTTLATSGVLTGTDAAVHLTADVTGQTELRLVVADAGNGNGWDHADWADAQITCDDGGDPPADTTPPEVTGFSPAANATDVPITADITVTLSEQIDFDSVVDSVLLIEGGDPQPVDVTVDNGATGSIITLTPEVALMPNTTYSVIVPGGSGGVADLAGNPLAADLTWSFTTGVPADFPRFADPVSVPTGTNSHGVTTADLDGDDAEDLIVAATGDDAVVVRLGNGDGTFQPAATYATGTHPKAAAVADFNGDGLPDIASANQDDAAERDVSILLGTGNGAFQPATHLAACLHPHHPAAGDFNADGHNDLVVACWGGSVVSVLIGDGDGTFQPAVEYGAGSAPHAVAVADLNGDGDIAVANFNSNSVSILTGNGDGAFQNFRDVNTGAGPHAIIATDFNGDGAADLATANDGSDNVTVLLNDGSGEFNRDDVLANDQPKGITAADIDGDGLLDLITANVHGTYPTNAAVDTTITVLFGDQHGAFDNPEHYTVTQTPFSVAAADFNTDGRTDIATANWHTNDVAILLNQGG